MPTYDLGLEHVSLAFATKNIFTDVTQGVLEGDRIGIVGKNGDGKSTLLHLFKGTQEPDSGRVTMRNGLTFGMLDQRDPLDDNATVREAALEGREDYEWAAETKSREIVEALLGGISLDGKPLVTKTSFRILHTLTNLGTAPEPNLTVLWSKHLPENWKRFVAKVSCDTDAIQYESDTVMRPAFGDDYAIACCVSAMRVGKDMQFFGARANLAKLVLLAINGGMDEVKKTRVAPEMPVWPDEYVDFDGLLNRLDFYRDWLAKTYVDAMNTIHYMHDKYAYEKSQMALHDTNVRRLMAFGIAGMSCMADSLSAIKYAKVKPIRNPENGIIVDFEIEGDFPKFGNDDDRVDSIACEQVEKFYQALTQFPLYRGAIHTMSILTITSNVMYGKKTGNTPDGRRHGEPLAPGANPMSGRDVSGALASLNSVAKLSYTYCRDGISNTFSITPGALGKTEDEQVNNLVSIMGGYFAQNAHHLNVNVLNRETLMAAYEHPEQYPNLTIRVSGYAVNFYKLSREQQREVISRTFHEAI